MVMAQQDTSSLIMSAIPSQVSLLLIVDYLTALLKDYLGENRFSHSQWNFLNSTGSMTEKFSLQIEDQDSTDINQLLKMAFV